MYDLTSDMAIKVQLVSKWQNKT